MSSEPISGNSSFHHEVRRLPIIGVMGSGSNPYASLTRPLGKWLASQPVHLLTGGGSGVMSEISKAFCEEPSRIGHVVGVIPSASSEHPSVPKEGYPNEWVEIEIRTHLPYSGAEGTSNQSRNHINILTSDVIIFLPGGEGTRSEAILAQQYGQPMIGYYGEISVPPWFLELPKRTSDFKVVQQFVISNIRNPNRA